MSRIYKNVLKLRDRAYGTERRANLSKEILKDSTPLPQPLEYKDIDEAFKKWVEDDLAISFEGERIPTISLFSNQRFSEYMQSWANVDDKKNFLLNFKTITRENNPKGGTIVGTTRNIPGEPTFLMKRVEAKGEAGNSYYIDYRVKQPFSVDLIYTVGLVTNKYELLNDFNQIMNEKFKAIDCYIRPNGHFIPMKIDDISDESEYSIDNRQFYSQSYKITVMAYIMPKDSFIVEETPKLAFMGFEGDRGKKTYADIEELPCDLPDSKYAYDRINLTIHFDCCERAYKFTMDTYFQAKEVTLENIRTYSIYVNDEQRTIDENFRVKPGDVIQVKGVIKYNAFKDGEIKIIGFNYTTSHIKDDEEMVTNITINQKENGTI